MRSRVGLEWFMNLGTKIVHMNKCLQTMQTVHELVKVFVIMHT